MTIPEPPKLRSSDIRRMTSVTESCIWPDETCDRPQNSRRLCVRHYYIATRLKRLDEFPRKPVISGPSHEADRWLNDNGYVIARDESGRPAPEHRMVMERLIGRRLARGETVHHINGARHDNRPENLELWFSPQPYGQRVEDLLKYAVTHHAEKLRAALSAL